MGEAVQITGKFKTKKEKYEEVKQVLIAGLSEYLRPDDSPVRQESYFEITKDALELSFYSFGNYGFAQEYIEKTFIKEYSDVLVEFAVTVYEDESFTETIIYDGKTVRTEFESENYYDDEECFDEDEDLEWYEFEFDSIDSLKFEESIFVLTNLCTEDNKKISDIILNEGGVIKSSTVLKTNYLIVEECSLDPSKKYIRAIELKEQGKPISIISVRRFYELYKDYGDKKLK